VGILSLRLTLLLGLLELFNRRLEFLLSIFKVLLSCVSLLFEEFKLAIPESLVSIIRVIQVSVLSLKFIKLSSPPFNLLLDLSFITLQSHGKLLISFPKLIDLILIVLDEILLLLFKVLILF
jgi:hypothetical protein